MLYEATRHTVHQKYANPDNNALYTFSFLTLLYFAVFSIVSARERRWFWTTMPSKSLVGALTARLRESSCWANNGRQRPSSMAITISVW
jgi:hypothetical protein